MLLAPSAARLQATKKHVVDQAAAQQAMGKDAYSALTKDAKCNVKKAPGGGAAAAPGATQSSRCIELCQGKPECISVCNEVQAMICGGTYPYVYHADSTAAAAAAASAASSAVRDAVKEAVATAQAQSLAANKEAADSMKKAMAEAAEVAKMAARDA